VGGLVTTTNSGMAFRDWLTSDGHFMLLYPWFQAAGEKFIEHGHRLLGALVGVLAIGLVLVVSRTESRRWVRRFSWVILAGVVLQGVLGGMRVVFAVDHDNLARGLALLHGCTGPLFFALCVAMVVFTSPTWHRLGQSTELPQRVKKRNVLQQKKPLQKTLYVAFMTSVLAYGQLVVGAVVRHAPHMTGNLAATAFQAAVYFHLLLAGLLLIYVGLLLWRSGRAGVRSFGPTCLVALVVVQIGLGASTWVVKYGLPAWATSLVGQQNYVNRAADILPTVMITSHVAMGSLIAVTALSITLLLARRLWAGRLAVVPLGVDRPHTGQSDSQLPTNRLPSSQLLEVAL